VAEHWPPTSCPHHLEAETHRQQWTLSVMSVAAASDIASRHFASPLPLSRSTQTRGTYDFRARQWSPELGIFLAIDEYEYHDTRSHLWGWPQQNPMRSEIPLDAGTRVAVAPLAAGSTDDWGPDEPGGPGGSPPLPAPSPGGGDSPCSNGPCPSCPSPPPPTSRVDTSHPHYPCPGAHRHNFTYEYNQDPKTCQCFLRTRETIDCL
jgi:hypothetical protein